MTKRTPYSLRDDGDMTVVMLGLCCMAAIAALLFQVSGCTDQPERPSRYRPGQKVLLAVDGLPAQVLRRSWESDHWEYDLRVSQEPEYPIVMFDVREFEVEAYAE